MANLPTIITLPFTILSNFGKVLTISSVVGLLLVEILFEIGKMVFLIATMLYTVLKWLCLTVFTVLKWLCLTVFTVLKWICLTVFTVLNYVVVIFAYLVLVPLLYWIFAPCASWFNNDTEYEHDIFYDDYNERFQDAEERFERSFENMSPDLFPGLLFGQCCDSTT